MVGARLAAGAPRQLTYLKPLCAPCSCTGLHSHTHTPHRASPPRTHPMFPTIYEWSVAHIRDVFEAKSEDACRRALAETFAHDIEFTTNGRALAPHDLQRFVLAMVAGSGFRLQVHWQNALEVPRDESNRVSARRVAVTCAASADARAGVPGRRARRVLHHQQRPQARGGRRALGACRAAQVRQRRVRGSHLSRARTGTHAASSFSRSIESQSDDTTVDSRRIVRLNLTATDKPQ